MPRQIASSLRTPVRDTLPNNPQDGQEIRIYADKATGAIWTFRYNAKPAGEVIPGPVIPKWEHIGGVALVAFDDSVLDMTAALGAWQQTNVTLNIPWAGDYVVAWGSNFLAQGRNVCMEAAWGFGGPGANSCYVTVPPNSDPPTGYNSCSKQAPCSPGLSPISLVLALRRTISDVPCKSTGRYITLQPRRISG
jgi:hypothetical protein